MNILQLSYDYPPHVIWGSGTHCAALARGLTTVGNKVSVVTPHFEGPFGYVSEDGVDVLRVQVDYPSLSVQGSATDLFRVKLDAVNASLTQAALDEQLYPVDVIHIHSWMVFPAADNLRRAWGCPVVATLHILENEIANFIDKHELFVLAELGETLLLNGVDAVILPSQFLASRIPRERLSMEKRYVYGGPKSQDSFGAKIRQNSTIRESSYFPV